MSEKGFEISRRKALAGIGVVGVASAGAGLGTTAYFSDQEEFEDNTITAGEFGLTVKPGGHEVNQDGESQDVSWPGQVEWSEDYDLPGKNGEEPAIDGGSINIIDAKPGDDFKFCWKITVHDNPGYVQVSAENVVHNDGYDNEELEAGDLHDTEALEDLADNVNAYLRVYPGYGSESHLSEVEYDNLRDLLNSLENGVNIASDDEDPYQMDAGETVIVCVYLSIDADEVGNEIQGASTSADLIFYGEQSRHNEGSFPSGSPVGGNDDDGDDGN